MVIISSCGLQIKDKCGDLLKLVKNKKVFVCTNSLDREIKKNQFVDKAKENISDLVARLDDGELTVDNISKFINYYDCIYLAGGNVRLLGEMLNHKEIKEGLLKFINSGKIFITEGNASLIVIDDLSYINQITSSITEENMIYKNIDYSKIKTLSLTGEKIIVQVDNLNFFRSACKLYEKQNRASLTYLFNGDIFVI